MPGNKLLGYAAFVEATTPAGVTMSCSGALVTPEYVLTAAHCTVCTTSARVRFVGNPGVWYEAVPGGIHTNPAAFSHTDLGPVDCDQTDPAAYAAQVNQRTVFGSDLALIRIPPVDISDVADAHLMLSPPRGFSAVQWSVGRSAMLLGRGSAVEGGNDLGTMRRGWTSIDRFMPHPRDLDMGSEIVYVMSAVRGVPSGDVESFSTGGDSGGPVVAAVDGTDRIIGVISGGDPLGTTAAVTFAVPNATFLRGVLYGDPVPPADVDGDQVPDAFDNCPRDANRGQLDLDEDGWGDVCDNCPPTDEIVTPGWPLGAYLPLGPEDMARAYNPDQANCNDDAELTQLFRTMPSAFDGAGELIGTSDEEYRAATAGTPTLPPEHPVYAIRRIRRGDTCDPIPCGRSALSHGPMDIALIDPAQRTCLDFKGGPKECELTVPASIDITPIRDNEPGAQPEPGKVGVRYCTCDLAHATPAERRECGGPETGDCEINPNRYALVDPRWKMLSLNGQDPSTDVIASTEFKRTSEASSSVELAWDSLSDLERLTGVPLPEPPWHITEDGQIEGGPRLQGILWTRTTEYQGSDPASLPDDAWDRSYAELASSYRAADHRIGRETGGGVLPQYTDTCFPTCPPWQAMPWEFCTMCGFGVEMPWLWAVDDVVLAVTSTRQLDVTDRVAHVAPMLFGVGERVLASECETMLRSLGVSRREVVIDSTTLNVQHRVGVRDGRVVSLDRPVDRSLATTASSGSMPVSADCGGADFVTAMTHGGAQTRLSYSAVHDTLMALGRPRGCPAARLSVFEGAGWREIELDKPVAEPLSTAFHLREHALLVLERPAGWVAPIRLTRIDLHTGHVERLARVALGRNARAELTVLPGGDLMVAISRQRPRYTRMARLRLSGQGVQRVSWKLVPGQWFGGGLRGNERVVQYLDQMDGAYRLRSVSLDSFHPAPHHGNGWLCP